MKKTARILAVLMMIAIVATAFVGCAKQLSGTYKNEGVSYEFKGNKFTKTVVVSVGSLSNTTTYSGTYEIKEDPDDSEKLVIVFTTVDGDNSKSETYSFSEGVVDGKKVILIGDGLLGATKTYTKQ